MKDSFKKRLYTKEKESIFTGLAADPTINRLLADCKTAGASHLHLMCLVVYCYQLGLETGYTTGYTQGRSAGIKLVHDEVFKNDRKGEV